MPPFNRIMVPIDWSEPSIRAFQMASSLAQKHDAQLVVLHVVPLPTVMYGPASESYLEHIREELTRIQTADPCRRIEYVVTEGDPALAIVQAARDNRCDLIVMGTHGRGGLNRFVLGSVADAVTRKAPCPVMTLNSVENHAAAGSGT